MTTQPTPKKRTRKIVERITEPSSLAGWGVLAGVALPGLLTYLQTGSKTQGIVAILAGLAGGGAIVKSEKGAAPQ